MLQRGLAHPYGDYEAGDYLCDKSASKTSAQLFLKHLLQVGLNRLSEK